MIEVTLSVTINGRSVAISDGYDSPPAAWADNDQEAATALCFQLLEQMCTALDTDFECPPEEPDGDAETPTNTEPDAFAAYRKACGDEEQSFNSGTPAAQRRFAVSNLVDSIQRNLSVAEHARLRRLAERAGAPPDLIAGTDLTDDAFNNPDHIVIAQDGDAGLDTWTPGINKADEPHTGSMPEDQG